MSQISFSSIAPRRRLPREIENLRFNSVKICSSFHRMKAHAAARPRGRHVPPGPSDRQKRPPEPWPPGRTRGRECRGHILLTQSAANIGRLATTSSFIRVSSASPRRWISPAQRTHGIRHWPSGNLDRRGTGDIHRARVSGAVPLGAAAFTLACG
jgi:hypothetical protein